MKNKIFHSIAIGCSVTLLITATDTRPCGQPGTSPISALPSLGGSTVQANGLSAAGQITGFSFTTGDLEVHAFLLSGGSMLDLGALSGGIGAGNALNASGQVAGDGMTATGEIHALFHNGSTLTDIGTLGGDFSTATDINDAGQIVGNSSTTEGPQQAFIYSNGSMTSLGHLGNGSSSAVAINNLGNVTGNSPNEFGDMHGFFWTNDTMVDLGTLGGFATFVAAINDSDVIVGESDTLTEIHAFRYSTGTITDLGTLGGNFSSARGINASGQIFGLSSTASGETHGFFYSAGTMTDLGTLGGDFSTALAMNNLGQIVGGSSLANNDAHAFVWQDGTMLDLNSLLPTNSGWVLVQALFINDAGRVVGLGNTNGVPATFIMDLGLGDNPPVANAGADQTVDCQAQASLDGSQSNDPDNDVLTFEWREGAVLLGTNSTLSISLPTGIHTITLTVIDPCGAFSVDEVLVTVEDTTAPTVTCPAGLSVSANGSCQALVPNLVSQVSATDNCAAPGSLGIVQSPAAGTVVGLGQHTLTFTVTDPSGNSAQCTTLLTVVDTNAPVIISGPTISPITANAQCQAAVPSVTGDITATDNCTSAGSLVISQSPVAGTLVGVGSHTIIVTVTDVAGNSTSGSLSFTVVDTTAPSIVSLPAPVTVSVGVACQATVPNVVGSVSATDNCTAANQLVITQNPAAGTSVGLGSHTIVVTVTDLSGNHVNGNVSLNVVDSTAPAVVSSPGPITVTANAQCEGVVPNVVPDIVATDNCTAAGDLTITQSPAAGTLLATGTHTITVTLTDASGNSSTATVTLLIKDTIAPVINSLSVTPNVLSPPNHMTIPVTVSVSSTDSCDPAPVCKIISIAANESTDPGDFVITGNLTANLVATRNPGGNGRVYTITVECKDFSGNSATGTVTVTVPKGNGGGGGGRP